MSIASRLISRINQINEAVALNFSTVSRYHTYFDLITKKFGLGPKSQEFKILGSKHYIYRYGPATTLKIAAKYVYVLLNFQDSAKAKFGYITHYLVSDKKYSKGFTKTPTGYSVNSEEFTIIPKDIVKFEDIILLITGETKIEKPRVATKTDYSKLELTDNKDKWEKYLSENGYTNKPFPSKGKESPFVLSRYVHSTLPDISLYTYKDTKVIAALDSSTSSLRSRKVLNPEDINISYSSSVSDAIKCKNIEVALTGILYKLNNWEHPIVSRLMEYVPNGTYSPKLPFGNCHNNVMKNVGPEYKKYTGTRYEYIDKYWYSTGGHSFHVKDGKVAEFTVTDSDPTDPTKIAYFGVEFNNKSEFKYYWD